MFIHGLNDDDHHQRFANTDCQQELSRLVRGQPDGTCTEDIAYVIRYRHCVDQPLKEWPLCELHMREALKKGARIVVTSLYE
jgi:hypothetical protein